MSATSVKQRRFFGWLEHNPAQAASEGVHVKMDRSQMHDFAATPEKGLPKIAPKAPSVPKFGAKRTGRKFYGEGT